MNIFEHVVSFVFHGIMRFCKKTLGFITNTLSLSLRKRVFIFGLVIVPFGSLSPLTDTFSEAHIPLSYESVATMTDSVLTLTEPIVFTFDAPQNTDALVVSTVPEMSVHTTWNDEHTELTVKPSSTWQPDTAYTVALTPRSLEKDLPSALFSFHTEDVPHVVESMPRNGAKDVTLKNNDEIVIRFDRSTEHVDITALIDDESNSFAQTFDTEKKVMTLVLPKKITEKKDLTITLYGKYEATEGDFTLLGELTFHVIPTKPEQWPADRLERLAIASETTRPYITKGKYIDVNLQARITTLFENGSIVSQFINSPGAEETPTPTGIFHIENKALKPTSAMFGVLLPFWMAFTPDGKYGFHDLVEWPANNPDFPDSPLGGKESLASIDQAISPGCVRHNSTNSQSFYDWTDIGTPVRIY